MIREQVTNTFRQKAVKALTLLLLMAALQASAQSANQIELKVDPIKSTYFSPAYKATIDSAFMIASAILSSQEFRDKLANVRVPGWNRCKNGACKPTKRYGKDDSISASGILSQLYKEPSVTMAIALEEKSRSSLGSTCPGNYATAAYFNNIVSDMPDIPWAYAIAANLCHEYMHHIGFCHKKNSFDEPDENTPDPYYFPRDIAYRVGWEAYYIAREWVSSKKAIKGL